MQNPLDLRRMRHLRAVVSEGSLTSAASHLGLSQPALSASIKSLEADLGVTLFKRNRFGVEPTPYAQVLLGHARSIDQELDDAWSNVARLKGSEVVSLRIGCGPSEATRLLPIALLRLRTAQPTMRIFVEYGLNEALMPMVRRGEVDCALSSIPRSAAHPELQHEALHVDGAVIVARTAHPLATRRTLTGRDLAAFPWVLARHWELERRALDELFAQAGEKPVQAQIETTSAVLMKTIVMQSDFLTFVPHEMIVWEERANLLRPLRGIQSSWERHVGITTRRDEPPGQATERLIVALRESARAFNRR
jgi:DNA-binding transcriptional LysR family regulator